MEITSIFILFVYSWICFSQLPYLPEMDALQSDLKIINQCYQHLSKTKQSDDLAYIDAYKYTFSRTGNYRYVCIILVLIFLIASTTAVFSVIINDLLKIEQMRNTKL